MTMKTTLIMAWVGLLLVTGGCAGLSKQLNSDALGRDALEALGRNDETELARYVGAEQAAPLVAAQPKLEDPRIDYVRDEYPWPGPIYYRWYTLGPGVDDPSVRVEPYKVTFRHHPEYDVFTIDSIRHDDGR